MNQSESSSMRKRFCALVVPLLVALALPAHASDEAMPEGIKHHPAVLAADWGKVETIVIELGDHIYEPDELNLKVGQPYKLVLRNIGRVAHDMVGGSFFDEDVIALRMVNSRVGRVMADHINSIFIRTKNEAEMWLVPIKDGEFTFFCSLPGHRDGGMEGFIYVEP